METYTARAYINKEMEIERKVDISCNFMGKLDTWRVSHKHQKILESEQGRGGYFPHLHYRASALPVLHIIFSALYFIIELLINLK